jgi:hypothetical protein
VAVAVGLKALKFMLAHGFLIHRLNQLQVENIFKNLICNVPEKKPRHFFLELLHFLVIVLSDMV